MQDTLQFVVKVISTNDNKSKIEEFDQYFAKDERLINTCEFEQVRQQLVNILLSSNVQFKFKYNSRSIMGKALIILFGVYIDRFFVQQGTNIQYQVKKCKIKLLDYSDQHLLEIVNNKFFMDNEVQQLYLPKNICKIQFTVSKVYYSSVENLVILKVINLQQFRPVQNIGESNFMDLSICRSLKEINISQLQNNIKLPCELDNLILSGYQKSMFIQNYKNFSILNTVLKANYIKLNYICLKLVKSLQYEKIDLTYCNLNTFTTVETTKEQISKQFNYCGFKTLNLSKLNTLEINDNDLFSRTFANKVIIPKQARQISLVYQRNYNQIKNIIFTSYKHLEKLVILGKVPKNIYLKGSEKINFIDLSKFDKLMHVEIKELDNNILLPDKLDTLILKQNKRTYQILNQNIISKVLKLKNFNLKQQIFDQNLYTYKQIDLQSCFIDAIIIINSTLIPFYFNNCDIKIFDYSQSISVQFDKNSTNTYNEIEKIILPNNQSKILLTRKQAKIFEFCSYQFLEQLEIDFSEQVEIRLPTQQDDGKLDLSMFSKLKYVDIHCIQVDILLLKQLDELRLSQYTHICQYVENEQKNCYQILNNIIQAKIIDIHGYDLSGNKLTYFQKIKLQDCRLRYLSFNEVLIEPEQTYLDLFSRQFDIQQCIIGTLEFSQFKFSTFCYNQYFCYSRINKLNFNSKLQNLQVSDQINIINFSSCIYLESIKIEYITKITINNEVKQLENHSKDICNGVIDISLFINLKIVKLSFIENDIKLPNRLERLEISQKEKYKCQILNTQIESKFINIKKFSFDNIELIGFDIIKLQECRITNLFVTKHNEYISNDISNQISEPYYKELNIYLSQINSLVIPKQFVEKLSIKCLVEIKDKHLGESFLIEQNQNYCENSSALNQNYQQIQLDSSASLDFSQYKNLKEIHINIYYIDQVILLPIQLQSIQLCHNNALQAQQLSQINFSDLINLQNIEIWHFKINQLILCQGNLQFIFNTNFVTGITIKSLRNESDQTFNSFITNIDSLKIKGLKQMIFNRNVLDYHDFSIFDKLCTLQLFNIENQIAFPKSIKAFKIQNESVQYLQNFDFKELLLLKNIVLHNCQIGSLFTKQNIRCSIQDCNINYLRYHETKELLCNKDIRNCCNNLQYFGQNNTIQTLNLVNINILQTLEINGLKKIAFNNIRSFENSDILDFTNFDSLTHIKLTNMRCQGIIFGKILRQIQINRLENSTIESNSTIQFLDFSQCQNINTYSQNYIKNYEIDQVFPSSGTNIHFKSPIKIINLCKSAIKDNQLQDYLYWYRKTGRYLLYKKTESKQRILYKFHQEGSVNQGNSNQQAALFVNMALILESKINYIYKRIQQLLDE